MDNDLQDVIGQLFNRRNIERLVNQVNNQHNVNVHGINEMAMNMFGLIRNNNRDNGIREQYAASEDRPYQLTSPIQLTALVTLLGEELDILPHEDTDYSTFKDLTIDQIKLLIPVIPETVELSLPIHTNPELVKLVRDSDLQLRLSLEKVTSIDQIKNYISNSSRTVEVLIDGNLLISYLELKNIPYSIVVTESVDINTLNYSIIDRLGRVEEKSMQHLLWLSVKYCNEELLLAIKNYGYIPVRPFTSADNEHPSQEDIRFLTRHLHGKESSFLALKYYEYLKMGIKVAHSHLLLVNYDKNLSYILREELKRLPQIECCLIILHANNPRFFQYVGRTMDASYVNELLDKIRVEYEEKKSITDIRSVNSATLIANCENLSEVELSEENRQFLLNTNHPLVLELVIKLWSSGVINLDNYHGINDRVDYMIEVNYSRSVKSARNIGDKMIE